MVIDTEKFAKDFDRMCNRDRCTECPLHKIDNCNSLEDINEIAPIVIKWAEEHPAKTYRMDFKEKFPNSPIDDVARCFCLKNYYGENAGLCSCGCENCKDCWNREME